MILLIDNYDSFTYNLYQYLSELDEVKVVRNDKIDIAGIEELNPDKIVLSPGPKTPREAGICIDVIKHFYNKVPLLGICLGHQAMGDAFGADIVHAKELYHGRYSEITHDGKGVFQGISQNTKVARYHSLAIKKDTLSDEFEISAETEDGEIMAIRHKEYKVVGLQFHPESIYTPEGMKMLENFMKL